MFLSWLWRGLGILIQAKLYILACLERIGEELAVTVNALVVKLSLLRLM